MRGVERVIVGSEFARRQAAQDLAVPLEKFSVVYYGVDRRFRPAPKPESLVKQFGLENKGVALFVGGLKRRKNLFFLLEIWREVTLRRDDARLVVVGSGPMLGSLKRYASRLGLDNRVIFTGYVPDEQKADYYNLADLLVFPSAMEGFGLTVAEAMSSELPVVVSARGSLPELVVDGDGGFLCDPSDHEAFVRRVLLLLSDAMLRQKFGVANRERVDWLFRWDQCAATTARIYEEVLEDWRNRARPG
jgi:glycosyltransferase involved in cell wall biosynthesis